ncbi:MAG TPA: hypothetical protein VNN80_34610, partial [Polyangiaceae bacterium]|nr:hypothetical protein [Polyangiaceae bacterium]
MVWRVCGTCSLAEPALNPRCGRGPGAALLGLLVLAAGCGDSLAEEPVDCSPEASKAFVADIMGDYYLWYDLVPPVDIAALASPEEVMRAMTYR